MASSSSTSAPLRSADLLDLVSSSGSATVYPSDDQILVALQTRFRQDLPFARVGSQHLVAINPHKALANTNDVSAHDYEERCYRDTALALPGAQPPLPPHPYELAAQVYLLMRRRNESQSVIFRGITGSGKTYNRDLVLNQLLRLSAHSKRESRLADQVRALSPLLDAFGNAKTLLSPNASRHGRYLELHFSDRGRVQGAKVLAYALDKSRLTRLHHEERSFHVFYQLLAGATPQERDQFNLEDPSDYALLASSGCYRLPAGPFSDDASGMEALRDSMRMLGFKPKHVNAILGLLVAILLLSNVQYWESDGKDVSAYVANMPVVDQIARLLGVPAEDLAQVLTNKTSYVRKEVYTVFLSPEQCAAQRDQFMRDMYAMLFAFVVETANHRLAPGPDDRPPHAQIVLLDQPGFQSKGPASTGSMGMPLVHAYGSNGFDEFAINFADEILHSYFVRATFEDAVGFNAVVTGDGVALPAITTMDNSGAIELLRGAQLSERAHKKSGGMLEVFRKACTALKSGKASEKKDEDLLQDLVARFGVHASFVSAPPAESRTSFGINHYAGPCSYDVASFVERDTDLVDAAFVTLLRNSSDPFVAKLFAGPSLAAERHPKDENTLVQAQVSSPPLRPPTAIPGPGGAASDEHPRLDPAKIYPVTTQINYTLSEITAALDRTRLWTVSCIRPNDSGSPNSFDRRRVKAQIRALLLPDVIARRASADFAVEYDVDAFCERYVPTMGGSSEDRVRQCAHANGWKEGVDYALGHRMIFLRYSAWKMVEDGVRAGEKAPRDDASAYEDGASEYTHDQHPPPMPQNPFERSADELHAPGAGYAEGGLLSPAQGQGQYVSPFRSDADSQWGSEYDKKEPSGPGDDAGVSKEGLVVKDAPNAIEEVPTSRVRRYWLYIVWATTWWIPTSCLTRVGRMKRPDVRLAWREKLTIFWIIFLFNAVVIFYIVALSRLLCPAYDRAWNLSELNQHQGQSDYFVAVAGKVYDVSNFVQGQHSDIQGEDSNTADVLEPLAGQDLTYYFPVPLALGCSLVTDQSLSLTFQNFTPLVPTAVHTSGQLQPNTGSHLRAEDWYTSRFQPTLKPFLSGDLVFDKKALWNGANSDDDKRAWALVDDKLYDLTDYFNTIQTNVNNDAFVFLDENIASLFQQRAGQDISKPFGDALAKLNGTAAEQNMQCLNNLFYRGKSDFRKSARCQVAPVIILVFSIILSASVLIKFLAALQLSSKRSPELQDKFVLCQVPCYTEGEDSLRRTIDSLASLNYDDKRKLIFIICDGNIIGSGNDRTTPRIVLDILGVDPKLDPEPLLFKSVGEGSRALNYGKIYSGLYEFEGHVVPYVVVVKVGKPTERSKPGNRGKRDSQVLVMSYLNKVHFDAPMAPLELEIYHQMRNVIGIDPAFYEYIFTVDADTTVTPDSLNRLVAHSADDQKIIGICGETRLENEEGSWWTMIQVYEYYISHHLSKAFESLFGSVTCLPGCFSLYRIRTADKGRPIIISSRIIDEYAEPLVDTLHKKNLFSLGEDRFLTTLLMKHFPTFKTKFSPDAQARTVAPESWRVLLSQRRRWINSTVHNLCELVLLPELFGFCCFSMRFFVFIDLLGTMILPSTVVYLVYLIVTVATGNAPFPLISIILIAAVYGLQALIFIIKREFMLVGWMVVYILSYPVYSFLLPVYSFWRMDDFGWGNTRLVVGEGNSKKVIVNEDDKFDESMIPLKKFSEYEAETWETGSLGTHHTGVSKPPMRSQGSRPASPHSYVGASQSGDFYRDTNALKPGSTPRSQQGSHSIHNAPGVQPAMSQYGGVPQLPFMPFGGSAAGSDYGGHAPAMGMGMPMQMPMQMQYTGSMYGMQMMPPSGPMMANFTGGNFGSGMSATGSMGGGVGGGSGMGSGMQSGGGRPASTFSFATNVNPFAGPSTNENPSDEELVQALRNYLSTQDLMTVTKKTTREAIMAKFPKADLAARKAFLNESIDRILSES